MIGETIGNFRIVARLGRGGMGEVWLAEQLSIETKVAIKMLRSEISEDTDHVRRFFNEARAVGRIRHAGIVKIFDVGFHAGQAYLVMEYLEGETLGARLRANGRLPIKDLADVGKQIASVLDATHAAGITHRDLKPDNVFVVPDHELPRGERIKILDFGVAKLTGTLAGNSPRTQGTLGTPAYMAPEQWGDAAKVDWRADAYSLGCIAFEMACGRPPFKVTTYAAACHKHLHEPPPTVRSLVPGAPAELDALVARLLEKDPGDRGESIAAIGRAFAAIGDAATDDTIPGAPRGRAARPAIGTEAPASPSRAAAPAVVDPEADAHAATVSSARGLGVSTDAETIDDTTMGGSAAQVERKPAARRRGAAIAIVAGVAAAAVGGFAVVKATRTPAATVTPDARAVPDAPPPPPPVDAPAPPPVPLPPAIDASPPPADARAKRRADAEAIPYEALPDEFDVVAGSKIEDRAVKRMQRCGPWTNEDGYAADFRIGMDGEVRELELVGPDPEIKVCMAKILRAGKYPMSKHGHSVSMNITR